MSYSALIPYSQDQGETQTKREIEGGGAQTKRERGGEKEGGGEEAKDRKGEGKERAKRSGIKGVCERGINKDKEEGQRERRGRYS